MQSGPRIVIVGSSNTDMVARAPRLPGPGETVLGDSFEMVGGGKGANQAVAAARLGASVTFVSRVGADIFGGAAMDGFVAEGIDTSFVVRDPNAPTGIALIGVSSSGENSIIVAPGANSRLTPADVDAAADAIRSANIVVCKFEVPVDAVVRAFETAQAAGVTTLLNPAPARELPQYLLGLTSIVTPNESESAQISGISTSRVKQAKMLRERGVKTAIITLGAAGAYVDSDTWTGTVPGKSVSEVVDTTAAGDCFTGALAVALSEGKRLQVAVSFANAAAALSVTKAGAQPSMPSRNHVDVFVSQ
jgi:ribokinase